MILAKLSVLEIILYSIMVGGFIIWLIFTIKGKKKKNKDEEEDDKE